MIVLPKFMESEAIESHLKLHKQLTGRIPKEEMLTEKVIEGFNKASKQDDISCLDCSIDDCQNCPKKQ